MFKIFILIFKYCCVRVFVLITEVLALPLNVAPEASLYANPGTYPLYRRPLGRHVSRAETELQLELGSVHY